MESSPLASSRQQPDFFHAAICAGMKAAASSQIQRQRALMR
jgi:hypothetical protein